MAVTPPITSLVMHDDRLNMFVSTQDLEETLKTLAAIVIDFTFRYPQAAVYLNWPPEQYVLDVVSAQSPLRVLYQVLFEHMSENGYPVTMLTNTTVYHHAPRKNTVLQVSTQHRLTKLN